VHPVLCPVHVPLHPGPQAKLLVVGAFDLAPAGGVIQRPERGSCAVGVAWRVIDAVGVAWRVVGAVGVA
jgi:hypothetical protein